MSFGDRKHTRSTRLYLSPPPHSSNLSIVDEGKGHVRFLGFLIGYGSIEDLRDSFGAVIAVNGTMAVIRVR